MDTDADVRALEDSTVVEDGPTVESPPQVVIESPPAPRAWRVARPRDGLPLRRFLDRAKLSLAEAASLASLVLEAVAAMHESGCGHGAIDSRSVRVVPDGTVRLAEFGPDTPFPVGLDDEVKRADLAAAAGIVAEITRSAGRPARPLREAEERLLSRLQAAADPARLRRRGPLAAARGLDRAVGGAERCQAARQGVAGLARAIVGPPEPGVSGNGQGPVGGRSPGAPSERRLPAPARRPPRWRRLWKVPAALVVVAVAFGVELHFFGDHVRRNVDALTGGAVAAPPAGPRRPGPIPVLGPPAAGPITHLELRPLEGCRPEAVCSGVVQLTVAAQPTPLDVAWRFELVDRCNGQRESRPGGMLSVPPGKDRALQTVSVPLPPGRALALVPVTESPARVAGVAMPLFAGTQSSRDAVC